jgi:RNA polymerase sigma-70 factor (ECF subfamily)
VTKPTDKELMVAVQNGDLEKLGDLFERHHSRIYSFCFRLTGKAAAAEDLTQETFLRALRYNRTFKGTSDFLPWLYRVARNVANDHFRRRGVPEHGVETLPEVPSGERPVAEALELAEDSERLRAALDRLPAAGREVLVLSRFEYRKYEEIGQILGCSVGAVKTRAHRALKQLGEIYRGLAAQGSKRAREVAS